MLRTSYLLCDRRITTHLSQKQFAFSTTLIETKNEAAMRQPRSYLEKIGLTWLSVIS